MTDVEWLRAEADYCIAWHNDETGQLFHKIADRLEKLEEASREILELCPQIPDHYEYGCWYLAKEKLSAALNEPASPSSPAGTAGSQSDAPQCGPG